MKIIIFVLGFYILFLHPHSKVEAKKRGSSQTLIKAIREGDSDKVEDFLANYSFNLHEEVYEEDKKRASFLEERTSISFLALELSLLYRNEKRIKIAEMIQTQAKENCRKLTKRTHLSMTGGFTCILLLTTLLYHC